MAEDVEDVSLVMNEYSSQIRNVQGGLDHLGKVFKVPAGSLSSEPEITSGKF